MPLTEIVLPTLTEPLAEGQLVDGDPPPPEDDVVLVLVVVVVVFVVVVLVFVVLVFVVLVLVVVVPPPEPEPFTVKLLGTGLAEVNVPWKPKLVLAPEGRDPL